MEFPQLLVPVVVMTEFQRASIHLDNVTVALADWQATARVRELRWLYYR